jgi:hypothetical protein
MSSRRETEFDNAMQLSFEFDLALQHVRKNVQTIISSYKKNTDDINALSYKELTNVLEKKIYSIKYFKIKTSNNSYRDTETPVNNLFIENYPSLNSDYELLTNNIIANKILELKIGTHVMSIANITTVNKIQLEHPILHNHGPNENQLVSGSLGIIIGFVGGTT